jgi:endonuclease/exonuclease/phosphatase family metal-dependent hydrolase
MKLSLFLLFFTLSLNATNLKIASYNVENLFDMQNNGTEYQSYKPNKHNWTRQNFQKKLLNIAEVICDINTDIIGLQEIENENVLKLLKKRLRQVGCGYKYHAISHKKHSAIQVAILSKIPIQSTKEIVVNRKLKYRNILETKFSVDGHTFYVFNNHWASKRSAESTRMVSARALKKRFLSLPKNSEYILLGDFNNDYDEYLHMEPKHNNSKGRTAINHVLKSITKGGKFVRKNHLSMHTFFHYNLWLELANYQRWSHNFYGKKQALDSILLPHSLFDGKGIDYVKASFKVFKRNYLFHKKGYIFRWEYKKSKHKGRGYSDHLPIVANFSTSKNFNRELSHRRKASIDKLHSKNLSFPILLKKVKVIFKEKNRAIISQKYAKKNILIYGVKNDFILGKEYDIMVYKRKKYKGAYEIIDFELEKRYDAL